jgi:hypothetical protein
MALLPWLTAKRSACPNLQRLPKRDLDTSVNQLPVISENPAFYAVPEYYLCSR